MDAQTRDEIQTVLARSAQDDLIDDLERPVKVVSFDTLDDGRRAIYSAAAPGSGLEGGSDVHVISVLCKTEDGEDLERNVFAC